MASIVKRTTTRGPRYDVRYRDPVGQVRAKTFPRRSDADRYARNYEGRERILKALGAGIDDDDL